MAQLPSFQSFPAKKGVTWVKVERRSVDTSSGRRLPKILQAGLDIGEKQLLRFRSFAQRSDCGQACKLETQTQVSLLVLAFSVFSLCLRRNNYLVAHKIQHSVNWGKTTWFHNIPVGDSCYILFRSICSMVCTHSLQRKLSGDLGSTNTGTTQKKKPF